MIREEVKSSFEYQPPHELYDFSGLLNPGLFRLSFLALFLFQCTHFPIDPMKWRGVVVAQQNDTVVSEFSFPI